MRHSQAQIAHVLWVFATDDLNNFGSSQYFLCFAWKGSSWLNSHRPRLHTEQYQKWDYPHESKTQLYLYAWLIQPVQAKYILRKWLYRIRVLLIRIELVLIFVPSYILITIAFPNQNLFPSLFRNIYKALFHSKSWPPDIAAFFF